MRIKSKNQINYRSVFNIYLLSIILITIAIAPNFASDPFNILKASILLASSIFLSLLLIFVISIKNIFFQNKELILLVLFPINLIIVAMLTSSSKIQQIYGVFGRRTGLLTYLSFFLFFLITVAFGKYLKLNRIISSFFILGFVNAIYSLLQPLGLFRIENLASKNVQPFGFFGNTNFQSAFLGFTLILSFANFGINISKKSYYKFVINMARLIIIFSLYKSDSQQGFIIFLSGIYIFCVVYFFISQNHLKFILALVFGLFSFTLFALGLFNLGPASPIIFQESVQARIFYWETAIRIIQSNPIHGVGLDSYGDWWWKYRDYDAIKFLGENSFTTSAHNIFLDLGAGGGVPLLLTYLIFNLVIFLISFRIFKRMSKVNLNVLIIFSAWMAFQVFSLISINHIGVGIWFWIFSGALVNIYLTSENSNLSPQPIGAYRFRILSSILLVLVFVSPIFRESISFERIRKSENLSVLINYYENHQLFSNNLLYVSYKLKTLGYDTSSLEANRILINKFPNFYDGWNLLIFQNEAREDEKVLAREQLLRLDPLNSGK